MPATLTEELLAAPVLDPKDMQALHLLEDLLGLHCLCASRPSPYCQVHSGKGLIDALVRLQEAHADALVEAKEEGEKEKESDLEAAEARIEELEKEAEKATHVECVAEDLIAAAHEVINKASGGADFGELAAAVKAMEEALK